MFRQPLIWKTLRARRVVPEQTRGWDARVGSTDRV